MPIRPGPTPPYLTTAATLSAAAGIALALAFIGGGCTQPRTGRFEIQSQHDLRRSVVDAAQREVAPASDHPAPVVTMRPSTLEELGIKPDLLPELENMAGPQAYVNRPLPLGENLVGTPVQTVTVSLERLVRTAAERN